MKRQADTPWFTVIDWCRKVSPKEPMIILFLQSARYGMHDSEKRYRILIAKFGKNIHYGSFQVKLTAAAVKNARTGYLARMVIWTKMYTMVPFRNCKTVGLIYKSGHTRVRTADPPDVKSGCSEAPKVIIKNTKGHFLSKVTLVGTHGFEPRTPCL